MTRLSRLSIFNISILISYSSIICYILKKLREFDRKTRNHGDFPIFRSIELQLLQYLEFTTTTKNRHKRSSGDDDKDGVQYMSSSSSSSFFFIILFIIIRSIYLLLIFYKQDKDVFISECVRVID